MPLFSIVIPTYNRAHWVPWALQSVLDQTYGDFEVVVSDDCSEDETAQVVQAYKDERVRYVRPPHRLYVNDAYEFAFAQARGDYVCTLPDDCALTPRFLERLAAVISRHRPDMVCCQNARYYGPDAQLYENTKNQLHIDAFTGRLFVVRAIQEIQKRFAELDFSGPTQLATNVCFRRLFVEDIKLKAGGFYLPPNCEYIATTMALARVGSYLFLDVPMYVYGQLGGDNLTMAYRELDPEFRKRQQLDYHYVPLKGVFATNRRAESLLVAKHRLGGQLNEVSLNWAVYFRRYYQDLKWFQGRGYDVAQDLEEFEQLVAHQPQEIREEIAAIKAAFEPRRSPWRKAARAIISRVPFAPRVERYVRRGRSPKSRWPMVFHGERSGFRDLLECARKLDGLLSQLQPVEALAWPSATPLD